MRNSREISRLAAFFSTEFVKMLALHKLDLAQLSPTQMRHWIKFYLSRRVAQ